MADENLTMKLNVPVTPEMHAAVDNAAWSRRMTKADLVRRALEAYLASPARPAEPVSPASTAEHQFGGGRAHLEPPR